MQTLSEEQLVGQTLGNYRIEHLVGKGQLTTVYLARHIAEQRVDALTLYLMPESFSNESQMSFLTRFRKEAALITTLDHPHILPVSAHGEVAGYPYLVTPYMMHGSLADMIKQEGRVEHTQVRLLLDQIVEGLAYAHARGFIHGTLKPANIVWRRDDTLQVAGFGLMHMLQRSGIDAGPQQYAHLLSVANTFLAAPEYVAPEVVAGQSIDRRSDIYAVGCILFELLSGQPPFSGSNPLEVAPQHVNKPTPSLRVVCPDIPITLALVVSQAMMRDPAQRFLDVNELNEAFAQASLGATQHNIPAIKAPSVKQASAGQNNANATGPWQFLPPIVTGRMPSVKAPVRNTDARIPQPIRESTAAPGTYSSSAKMARVENKQAETGAYMVPAPPTLPPSVPVDFVAPEVQVQPKVQPMPGSEVKPRTTKDLNGMPMPGVTLSGHLMSEDELMKNYGWWSSSDALKLAASSVQDTPSTPAKAKGPAPKPLVLPATDTLDWGLENVDAASANTGKNGKKRKATAPLKEPQRKVKRRRVVALLSASIVAAGVGAGVAFNFNKVPGLASLQQITQPPKTTAKTQPTTAAKGNPTTNKPAAGHTGTVVAEQTLAKNSAAQFTNPADKESSLLVHLPNGKFVAYEQACTHQGVAVNYDPKTQMFVCPAHGAIFDPAKGGAVVQGPATTPIATVKISVNADGTITV
jgi:serine/threonine protein kinase/Rieske Fe-S protein